MTGGGREKCHPDIVHQNARDESSERPIPMDIPDGRQTLGDPSDLPSSVHAFM